MSGWIMAIVGVISITVLADILLPEGDTSKYIKGVLSIFVVATIIAPIPKLFSKEWSLDGIFVEHYVEADGGYIEEVFNMRKSGQEDDIKDYLEANGYEIVQVVISVKEGNIYIIDRVDIEVKDGGEDSAEEIKKLLTQKLGDTSIYVGVG